MIYVCVLLKIEMRWNLLAVHSLGISQVFHIENSYKNINVAYTRKENCSLPLRWLLNSSAGGWVAVKINQKTTLDIIARLPLTPERAGVRVAGRWWFTGTSEREKLPHQKFSITAPAPKSSRSRDRWMRVEFSLFLHPILVTLSLSPLQFLNGWDELEENEKFLPLAWIVMLLHSRNQFSSGGSLCAG